MTIEGARGPRWTSFRKALYVKITPSARVLRMLGEIDFDEWQCVAELVDNSFDDFTEIRRAGTPWVGGLQVRVDLPASPDGRLIIADSGRGMDRSRLERSVRAGWSGNNPLDKLGLFGMGFNVATARLGRRTRVLTTRQGDPNWIGVEIDLDRIKDDFEADDISEPKGDINEHGTRIVIDHLQRDRADWLRRNGAALRNTLGGVYSWMLENEPFELWVGGIRVKPVRHCRWADDRFVMYNAKERIPAYIEIDEKLEDGLACADCGQWELQGEGRCTSCGGDQLLVRTRRIHGWLGIQRHLHKREYGIDFLRNGRKILRGDKQLFTWRNPHGSVGNEEPEYPVEMAHQGGRIIGEIHLDHVPVTYQKDAFQYGDRSWRSAVEVLRGRGPLLPQRATQLGYPENISPLGLLFKGFRRNDAGERCLIPGDGRNPIHEETRRWAQRFQQGDPGYQSDEIWWQAVRDHEHIKQQGKEDKAADSTPGNADEAAVLDALGLGSNARDHGEPSRGTAAGPALAGRPAAPPTANPRADASSIDGSGRSLAPPPVRETRQQRFERHMAASAPYPEISRMVGHPSIGYIDVEGRRLIGPDGRTANDLLLDENGHPAPLLVDERRGNKITVFVNLSHEAFQRFAISPAEALLVEAAARLKVQVSSPLSHSQLMAEFRSHSFPSAALDRNIVTEAGKELLHEIRIRMAAAIDHSGEPGRAFQYLSPDEQTATESAMITTGSPTSVANISHSGQFVLHAPPLFLVRLLEEWPEAFMDGHVFRGPYASVTSAPARRLSLARTVGYLTDVASQASFDGHPTATQMSRTRLSTALLADELGDEE